MNEDFLVVIGRRDYRKVHSRLEIGWVGLDVELLIENALSQQLRQLFRRHLLKALA